MTFPRPAGWKRHFQAQNSSFGHLGSPKRGLIGRCWASFGSRAIAFLRLPVEEKASSGLSGNARDGLFTLPVEEKLISGPPMRPKSGPLGVIWVPCDCLFPLRVKEKAIAGSLGMLAMASFPCLSRKRRFQGSPRIRMMDASFDPLRLPFLPPCREKNLGQGSPGMLTIAFSPCLSRNLWFQGYPARAKNCPFQMVKWFWMPASFRP